MLDAFALLVQHAGPGEVGEALAVPLGPWLEFRPKRPVMITADLVRCTDLASVPVAFVLGALGVEQLLVVPMVVAAAEICFTAASVTFLRYLLPPDDLLVANGRRESTTWTATML
ncbi:MFS transporter [Streptomyces galilaeus]|uniref:hypothetical protein n=1 Tax=Streptomyces galilaeus TaxID=33899 RepID=UPI0038F80B93